MDIRNTVLFRNTVLNFFGLVVPLAVGFLTIPMVVRALGTQRFGILALVWVAFGYFGLFDLGLGRTATKYISEALGKQEPERMPGYLWTTIGLQAGMGLAAALALWTAAPFISQRVLNIPDGFMAETVLTLRLVGLSLPIMFVTASFRGVLEASQRFDLVNAVKVPVNALFYILPLVGVALGYALPGIVVLLLVSRVAALLVWASLSVRVHPVLRARPALRGELVRPLFSFSGWLGLSSVLYAITSSMDRLIIGSLITVEAVAYYSAPYEAINRVGVIPVSLSMVLFPAFSYLDAGRNGDKAEDLFARSMKFILLTTGPIFLFLLFFAGDFLRLWLGPDFAEQSRLVVQFLAAGFLINAVIAVPNNYLLGIGRADIAPKYQAVELFAYAALALAGARFWGIKGVALASAVRLVAFTIFLLSASFKAGRIRPHILWRKGLSGVVTGLGLLALGLTANAALGFGIFGAGGLALLFLGAAFFRILDGEEREFLIAKLRAVRQPGRT